MDERSDNTKVFSYYEGFDERARLTDGAGLLEFYRMREIIERFIASSPMVILDVGGGPGRYSNWLAGSGHEVHLVDPVQKHLAQALEASESQPDYPIASVTEADARSLPQRDESADLLLLMGPLYHLPNREDRLAALEEARRVLKPGGILIAAAINRFASLIDGLVSGYIDDPAYISILQRDLSDGQHRPDSDTQGYFTTAFLHLPEELESEVLEVGFNKRGLYSVQGPGEYVTGLDERMSDPQKREQLLSLIRRVETERTLLGMASHFVVVAER